MSLLRGKQEFRDILTFNADNISKNFIKQALRDLEIENVVRSESGSYSFVENRIIVGMYHIQLSLQYGYEPNHKIKLKDQGELRVAIFEKKRNSLKYINLSRDKRFANQYWVKLNHNSDIKINTLTDIIIYLYRLDRLKLFL